MTLALLLIVFPFLMIFSAISDILTMTIPNPVPLTLAIGFAGMAILTGTSPATVVLHLMAGAGVLVVTFGFFACGWIGGGDAKLATATALWFGPTLALIDYAVLASLIGGGLTLLLLAARRIPLPAVAESWTWAQRLHDARTGVPYGIALATAGLIVYPQCALWKTAVNL